MNRNKHIPLSFTLFGATGDLATKKILPALCTLFEKNRLPSTFTIFAFSRRPWGDKEYQEFLVPFLKAKHFSNTTIQTFLEHITYVQGTFDDPQGYKRLHDAIKAFDTKIHSHVDSLSQKIYHLAIQPEFYANVINGLASVGLCMTDDVNNQPKIMVEKPIGHDLASAQELEILLSAHFAEKQKYRVDHYLGKEGLQAVLTERKNNASLDFRMNNQYVESLYVRIWDTEGLEGRGEFYDTVGTLRDVGQNHILLMLAMTTLDFPKNQSGEGIAEARTAILKALKPINLEKINAVVKRGQYRGYKKEEGVKKGSTTETYFKIQTEILNDRWRGVKVFLEGGKGLPARVSDIILKFKDGTEKSFNVQRSTSPDKPDSYEILIEQAIAGDKSLFVTSGEVIASWKFVTPVLQHFNDIRLHIYDMVDGGEGVRLARDFERFDPRFP